MVANNKTPIELSQVESVYSGVNGECCCGCSGKHYYTSAHRNEASERRGYEVKDAEVSDKMVKQVVKLMTEHASVTEDRDGHVALVIGSRLYVAYRTKAAIETMKSP